MINQFPNYLNSLSHLNGLGKGTPVQWLFYPGMLFSSSDKWWGDFRKRATCHEGVDITFYRTKDGPIQLLTPESKIPAMSDGIVANICSDFLGQSLVVSLPEFAGINHRILIVYAHMILDSEIKQDDCIQAGKVLGHVCDTKKNPQLPPHLHLSAFQVPLDIPLNKLNWKLFSQSSDILTIHPCFL